MKVKNKNLNLFNNIIKIVTSVVCVFAVAFCSLQIADAYKYEAITVSNISGDITVYNNGIDGLDITPAVTFNKTGDSITYKVDLTSPDGKSFQIKNVTDDNESLSLKTSYEFDKELNNLEKSVYITLKYENYIPYGADATFDAKDIHITFDIDEPESEESEAVGAPDASGPTAFIKGAGSARQTVLPYVIIGVLSAAVALIILVPKKHRPKFVGLSVLAGLIITGGFTAKEISALSEKFDLAIKIESIKMIPNLTTGEDVVTFVAPNFYNSAAITEGKSQGYGNAMILKTMDNKYVLMDTGYKKSGDTSVKNLIYSELVGLQGSENVTIDYLIISHLDADHYGNAIGILNDKKITVKNLVIKNEVAAENESYTTSRTKTYLKITSAALENNVNVITSGGNHLTAPKDIDFEALSQNEINEIIDDADDLGELDEEEVVSNGGTTNGPDFSEYQVTTNPETVAQPSSTVSRLTEGQVIEVGRYLKLHFFNTESVYKDKTCASGRGVDWTSSITNSSLYKTSDNKYVYFNAAEYPNVTLRTTTSLTQPSGGGVMDKYFYAKIDDANHSICKSNPNSYAVLAEVKGYDTSRYMYFPGDLENAGFSSIESGANTKQIFSNPTFDASTGQFKTDITPYTIASENNVADKIYALLDERATKEGLTTEAVLNNIVLYQASHHGGNNNSNAVWKLNMNRNTGIYAIMECSSNLNKSKGWRGYKTYHYTLGNIPADHKIKVGDKDSIDTECNLGLAGSFTCTQRTLPADVTNPRPIQK